MATTAQAFDALRQIADEAMDRKNYPAFDFIRRHIKSTAVELASLHAECEALRADAERLDYLQATGSTVDLPAICVPGRQPMVLAFRVGGLARAVNRDLRAAIDAARAAKEQSNDERR